MKKNYNNIMYEEISSFGGKPKLLLHCCCAPCSSAVIERISEFFQITYLYFNPNIFPEEEYNLRKEQFKHLGVKVVDLGYNHNYYLELIKGHEKDEEGGLRCRICIANRMDVAFKYAKEHNFDVVTTTLSISPHKDAEFINETGELLQEKYKIKYLHADFKKQNGFLRSTQISKEKGIYRQEYCGCEFAKDKFE